jgi:hypothetical protein
LKFVKTLFLLIAIAALSHAGTFSFEGTSTHNSDVQLFNVTIGASSDVVLRTWSWAGGVNAAGNTIARGGFDPILALFDSTGTRIGQNDDSPDGFVAVDAITGDAYDTYLALPSLASGTYTAAVMEWDNYAIGPKLSNGFTYGAGDNFAGGFPDWDGSDGHWAFDVLGVDAAVAPTGTPEPSSVLLISGGLLILCLKRFRKA